MIPIAIDTSEISAAFSLEQDQVDDMQELAIKRVADAFEQKWKAVAGRELRQTRDIYKNSIRTTFRDKTTAVVYLDPASWLANALEMGRGSFDMKTGFLNSSKVKYTNDGNPYLTIPFRFATPGAIADSGAFSGRMPKSIQSAVLKKQVKRGSTKPLEVGEIPEQFQIPKSRELRNKIDSITNLKMKERTSIYEGLQKTSGGYINFRRVSLASHSDSWIHPGFSELNLADKALQEVTPNIEDIVENSIDDFLDSLGF